MAVNFGTATCLGPCADVASRGVLLAACHLGREERWCPAHRLVTAPCELRDVEGRPEQGARLTCSIRGD